MKKFLLAAFIIMFVVGCSSTKNDDILEEVTFVKTEQEDIYIAQSWDDNEINIEYSEDGKLIHEELKSKDKVIKTASYEYEMEGDNVVQLTATLDMYPLNAERLTKHIYNHKYTYDDDLIVKSIRHIDMSTDGNTENIIYEADFAYDDNRKLKQAYVERKNKSGELVGVKKHTYNYVESDGVEYVIENIRYDSDKYQEYSEAFLLYKADNRSNDAYTAKGQSFLLDNKNNVFSLNEWHSGTETSNMKNNLNDILYYKTSLYRNVNSLGNSPKERHNEFIQIQDENGQSIGYKKRESDFYFEPITASNDEIKYDEVYYYNDADNNSYFKLNIDGGKANQYVKNLLDTDKYEDKDIAVITNIKINEDKSITKKKEIIDRNSELYNKLLSYKVDNTKTESFISSLNLSIDFPWDTSGFGDDEEVDDSVIAPPMDPRAHEVGKAKILGFLADNLYLIEDDASLLDNLKYEGPGDQVTKDLYAIYSDNDHPLIWLEIDLNTMTIYDFMTGEPLN